LVFSINTELGMMNIFINGVLTSTLSSEFGISELLPDAALSLNLDKGLCIFASDQDTSMLGGDVSNTTIYNRPLSELEIEELYVKFQSKNSWSCPQCTTKNVSHLPYCKVCNGPRPEAVLSGGQTGGAAGPLEPENPQLEFLRAALGRDLSQQEYDDAVQQVGDDPGLVLMHLMGSV
jgi:hypothetical protein